MAAIIATGLGAALSYGESDESSIKSEEKLFNIIPRKMGSIDIAATLCIVSTAFIFARKGAQFSKTVQQKTILKSQSLLLMVVGPLLLSRDFLPNNNNHKDVSAIQSAFTIIDAVKLGLTGVMSGFVAGFFGVGGGAVVVPSLVLFMGYDQKTALGTSLAGYISN